MPTTNGAIDVADLERVLASGPRGPVIVCLQSGNVNTGACDDLAAACEVSKRHAAWVHVDGAFGLWAAASPTTVTWCGGSSWPTPGAVTATRR